MTKKDDKHDEKPAKRVLATGASGDPEHPEIGAPVGTPTYLDEAPATEVKTQHKEDDK